MQRHGLFEELEREHCYPSMKAALAAIQGGTDTS
jgi:hypothetical protein